MNAQIETLVDKHRVCVLIPTYNNAKTLEKLIQGVLAYTSHVIVINDGSTDETASILARFKELEIITIEQNKGKGNALLKGFRKAIQLNYKHAITIDSDGQHFPEDLPLFLDKIDQEPGSLIMGARDMTQAEIPGKSSFGNKFSNFWYFVETGIKLPDTQTGYRLYPLDQIAKLRFFTKKFEFEIEVIVKLAWKGVNVTSVPVKVIYDYEDRVSHFRPFNDFTRISILNTYFFILTLIYYLPLRIVKKVRKEGIWKIIKKEWKENSGNDFKRSLSVGVGVMMGIFPIWGFQMLVAALLAFLFKLNKIIVVAASNISIPPLIPFILYFSYLIGGLFIPSPTSLSNWDDLTFDSVNLNFLQYFVGAVILSLITGFMAFLTSFVILKMVSKKNKKTLL